jgi:hypothetical protein
MEPVVREIIPFGVREFIPAFCAVARAKESVDESTQSNA